MGISFLYQKEIQYSNSGTNIPDKTCNQSLLYFHDCGRETAAFDFDFALSKTNRDSLARISA